MNYLEEELDETINTLKISSKKLNPEEIATLISTLTKKYFKTEKNVLDPVDFNEKCTEHNPDFWKEIPDRIKKTTSYFWFLTRVTEHGNSKTHKTLRC